jgi:hypothetical protein
MEIAVRKRLTLFVVLIFSIAACGPAPAPAPTQPPTAVTPSRTPVATSSPSLSFTPSRVPRVVVPTATPGASEATAVAVQATRIAPFLGDACVHVASWDFAISRDGYWALCEAADYEVDAVHRNGQKWTFSMRAFFGGEAAYYITPIFWTTDGKYLFFAPKAIVDSAYGLTPPNYYLGLLRWNLITGEVDTVLPASLESMYRLSISPTGRRLAYTLMASPLISIRDLKTGAEYSFQIDARYDLVSEFAWSADGTELRFGLSDHHGLYLAKVDVLNGSPPVIYVITPLPTLTPSQ